MIGLIFEGTQVQYIKNGYTILFFGLMLLIALGIYLLRSFGLYTLAKKSTEDNVKKFAYLSFVPFIWVYILGKIAGRINFYGKEAKSISLLLVFVYAVGKIMMFVVNVLIFAPVVIYFLKGGDVLINTTENILENTYFLNSNLVLGSDFIPYTNIVSVENALKVLNYASGMITFVAEIILIFVYIALFRKYWPLHSIGATILSIVGLFPIMVFLIRKKEPIDYNEFIRTRYQSMYGGFNNYNNYGDQNNQNNYSSKTDNNGNVDPFEDFNGSHNNVDDPFSEFNDNDKKDD